MSNFTLPEGNMRTLRLTILNTFAIIGISATYLIFFLITGVLLGLLAPDKLGVIFTSWALDIIAERLVWWVGIGCGWLGSIWMVWYLIRTRSHPPIPIKSDKSGAVEIATDALCTVARTEARSQGVKGKCRAEFTRKLGSPILQLFCDLTNGAGNDGPVAWGESIKTNIERRLLNDFNLKGVKVSVIHQPASRQVRQSAPQPVS